MQQAMCSWKRESCTALTNDWIYSKVCKLVRDLGAHADSLLYNVTNNADEKAYLSSLFKGLNKTVSHVVTDMESR